jgi:hypothetical protein
MHVLSFSSVWKDLKCPEDKTFAKQQIQVEMQAVSNFLGGA